MMLGSDVHGKTLGVVGFGRRARGFEMRVLYTGPQRAPEDIQRALGASLVGFDELLSEADFVSMHGPFTRRPAISSGRSSSTR